MTAPVRSAIRLLANKVRAYLAQDTIAAYYAALGQPIPVVGTTGWKQREQQLNASTTGANRVLFIPGSLGGGEEGPLDEPRRTGGNPRSIARWSRIVTAAIWSVDNAAPGNTSDEELQIEASDNLLELTMNAIVDVAKANVVFTKISRDTKGSVNMPFGREVLLEFVHREHLLGLAIPVVQGATPVVIRNPAS